MSTTYGMGLVAKNTNAGAFYGVELVHGQVVAPAASSVTLAQGVTNDYVASSFAYDAQLSAPPCAQLDLSFTVIPANDTISGSFSVDPPLTVPVTLTLYGNSGPIGKPVTLSPGQERMNFSWSVQGEQAFEDGGTTFVTSRTKQR